MIRKTQKVNCKRIHTGCEHGQEKPIVPEIERVKLNQNWDVTTISVSEKGNEPLEIDASDSHEGNPRRKKKRCRIEESWFLSMHHRIGIEVQNVEKRVK